MQSSTDSAQIILNRTTKTLNRMIKFYVAHKTMKYIHSQKTGDWENLEDELHNSYPIKGVRVRATKDNLNKFERDDGGFLEFEYPLSPDDVIDEINCYPIDAASASYLFMILEDYGDNIAKLVNPKYKVIEKSRSCKECGKVVASTSQRQSWHSGISGKLNPSKSEIKKSTESMESVFSALSSDSNTELAVTRLAKLKFYRNAYAHEGKALIKFHDFFCEAVAIVLFLYFFLLPDAAEIKAYPFMEYEGLVDDCSQ